MVIKRNCCGCHQCPTQERINVSRSVQSNLGIRTDVNGRELGVTWAWVGRELGLSWAWLDRELAVTWAWVEQTWSWVGRDFGVSWAWLINECDKWAWVSRDFSGGQAWLERGFGLSSSWLGHVLDMTWASESRFILKNQIWHPDPVNIVVEVSIQTPHC